jgi:ubiquinol-cytochrome c reductase subunit 6
VTTECAKSKECAPHKHHYDHCVERVTKQQEENDGKADEDCVEECMYLFEFGMLLQRMKTDDVF